MSLESLLNTIHTDAHSRITSTSKKRLEESIQQLSNYDLSTRQTHQLNIDAAALMRRHNKSMKGYEVMAENIYSHTDQLNESVEHTPVYDAFTSSRRNYVNRFADVHDQLNKGMNYFDALQLRDELISNNYLNKKADSDSDFSRQRQTLINRLDAELEDHISETVSQKYLATKRRQSLQEEINKTTVAAYAIVAAGAVSAIYNGLSLLF